MTFTFQKICFVFQCDPNLEVFGVWINTLDPTLPRIALFSRRDIHKGEELTFDYMMTGIVFSLLNKHTVGATISVATASTIV